jgi:micrococcal nuclease
MISSVTSSSTCTETDRRVRCEEAVSSCDDENTYYFHPFGGSEDPRPARVVDVYDGDTCRIAVCVHDDPSKVEKFNARIAGIDTPEIRGRSAAERTWARMARDYLRSVIWNTTVDVVVTRGGRMRRPVDPRKRLIVRITTLDGRSISDMMLAEGYAVPYMDEKGSKDYAKPDWKVLAQSKLDAMSDDSS